MRKILNLVIQDRCDPKNPVEIIESFTLRDDIGDPGQAIRSAVSEFIKSGTVEAREALDYANGCFNWGDAMRAVPDELFIKHGLTPLKQDSIDVFVDHNEILSCSDDDCSTLAIVRQLIKESISSGEQDITYWLRGQNLVAEGMAEKIAGRNEKLKTLLVMQEITENTIKELIETETDDDLIAIYESILDELST